MVLPPSCQASLRKKPNIVRLQQSLIISRLTRFCFTCFCFLSSRDDCRGNAAYPSRSDPQMCYLLQLLESLGTSPWVLINFYILEVEVSAVSWPTQFLEARIGSPLLAFIETYTSTTTRIPHNATTTLSAAFPTWSRQYNKYQCQ